MTDSGCDGRDNGGRGVPPGPLSGPFQLFDVELAEGANAFTIRATDLAGNSASLSANLTRAAANLTINPPTQQELAQSLLTVSGTISDNAYAVGVNLQVPDKPGTFTWIIPAKWRVGRGPEHNMPDHWRQDFSVQGDGTMTAQKFGHTVARATHGTYTTAR